MFKICIVDDETSVHQELKDDLEQYANEKGLMLVSKCYTSGSQFLKEYPVDANIVFMDIEMEGLDGMDTARLLRTRNPDVVIVFITNLSQYAVEGYAVDAADYLVKPVSYTDFSRMMDKAVNRSRRSEYNITVPVEGGFRKVNVYDLLYIETDGAYVLLHTRNETYRIKRPLREYEQELTDKGFLRCNSCYLINARYVTGIGQDTVRLGETELKISRGRKKEFLGLLTAQLGNEMMA